MRHLLIVLLPILLIGCDKLEQEPGKGQAEREASGGQAKWKARELQRKERVQSLVGSLAEGTLEDRHATYVELRDRFVRKRDIPELTREIERNASPEVKQSLQDIISFIKSNSRLPTGGWTHDATECHKAYERAFEDLGYPSVVAYQFGYPSGSIVLLLQVFDSPSGAKNQADAVGLILDLEPTALILWESWTDVSFLGVLSNLKGLTLIFTSVTDLTPLQGLTKLNQLDLEFAPVSDLAPLKGLPSLGRLKLDNTEVTDLTPLKGLTSLTELHLEDAKVTDLTPLKGLPSLRVLKLKNTEVTDLTPLKGLTSLAELHLESAKVIDLTPLNDLPYLDVIEVTDPMPLKGIDQTKAEQDGADQPATASESEVQGDQKPKTESVVRPQ